MSAASCHTAAVKRGTVLIQDALCNHGRKRSTLSTRLLLEHFRSIQMFHCASAEETRMQCMCVAGLSPNFTLVLCVYFAVSTTGSWFV